MGFGLVQSRISCSFEPHRKQRRSSVSDFPLFPWDGGKILFLAVAPKFRLPGLKAAFAFSFRGLKNFLFFLMSLTTALACTKVLCACLFLLRASCIITKASSSSSRSSPSDSSARRASPFPISESESPEAFPSPSASFPYSCSASLSDPSLASASNAL